MGKPIPVMNDEEIQPQTEAIISTGSHKCRLNDLCEHSCHRIRRDLAFLPGSRCHPIVVMFAEIVQFPVPGLYCNVLTGGP